MSWGMVRPVHYSRRVHQKRNEAAGSGGQGKWSTGAAAATRLVASRGYNTGGFPVDLALYSEVMVSLPEKVQCHPDRPRQLSVARQLRSPQLTAARRGENLIGPLATATLHA